MVPDPAALLAVIPARAGSRGVRGKNLQLLDGVPLVLRTIRTVISSGQASRVVVSTNDPAVAALARIQGVEVIDRPEDLAHPAVTILAVMAHAARQTGWEGLVAAFQPTCPLLTPGSIQRAVAAFRADGAPWGITAVRARHLLWMDGEPLTQRTNRQFPGEAAPLPFEESGAMTIATAARLTSSERLDPGDGVCLPLPDHEALDIDTPADLAAARLAVARRQILFEVAVGKQVGSGHLYRALRLAEGLGHHDCAIGFRGTAPTWAVAMLEERGLLAHDEGEYWDADMVIMDVLDTTAQQVSAWKAEDKTVVTFEDEGTGALYADLTINELLPAPSPYRKTLVGPRYAVLRPEFLGAPTRPPAGRIANILVSFGGTDPAGLNHRVAHVLGGYRPLVMAGPGTAVPTEGRNMAQSMAVADLVITSQGRTQYEAAALGIPTITIAANEREARHVRCPGHVHLGLHAAVSDGGLCEVVHRLSMAPELRAEMGATARAAVDGRGLERIVWRIDGLLAGFA